MYSVGSNREYTRCSDDGEPSGTAGRPMLDVILGEDIYNVAVVVTRYFGEFCWEQEDLSGLIPGRFRKVLQPAVLLRRKKESVSE